MTFIPKVKAERTDWRDKRISMRHKCYGLELPALDIDFLLSDKAWVEYGFTAIEYIKGGKAKAVIEYKHECAEGYCDERWHFLFNPLIDAIRPSIPIFCTFYANDFSWFKVYPINESAKKIMPEKPNKIPERQYVSFLYNVRNNPIILDDLKWKSILKEIAAKDWDNDF